MWIVFKNWDGCEADVKKFDQENEEKEYYESQIGFTSATMYMAKVEEKYG
ncbi:hypothetical protein [Siminovitchia sp. 179-K 8D1 HS]